MAAPSSSAQPEASIRDKNYAQASFAASAARIRAPISRAWRALLRPSDLFAREQRPNGDRWGAHVDLFWRGQS